MIEAAKPLDVPITHAYHILVSVSEYMSFFFSSLQKSVVGQEKFCPAAAMLPVSHVLKVYDSSGAVNFITSESISAHAALYSDTCQVVSVLKYICSACGNLS